MMAGVGVWVGLARGLDPTALRPEVGSWVEVRYFEAWGGRDHVMVANTRDLVYYRLEPSEAAAMALMDGSRTVAEIVVDHLRESGELDIRAVAELCTLLHAGGFLTWPYVDVDAALTRALAPTGPQARVGTFLRTMTVEWSGAERLTQWLHGHGLRWMFTRVGMAVAALVAMAGFVAFPAVVRGYRFEFAPQSPGVGFAVLWMLNMLVVGVHELGHATLLVHYGRRVRSAGVRLYFGTPAFFVDSSDVLMLDRRRRIAQSFAGPYFELVATGAAAIALWMWPQGALAEVLYPFVILNYFVLAMNLVPLLELDGYWILSDALRMPDLRTRSLAFMRRDLWVKLARRQQFSTAEMCLGLYGTVGVVFTIFCLVSAVTFWQRTSGGLAEQMWEAGPVGVFVLVILVGFLAGPLLRGLAQLVRAAGREVTALWRRALFRSQRDWRVEAALLLDQQPEFDDLPVEVLNDLAGRVMLRSVGRETAVIRQGDRADAFYLVRRGQLEVVETDPNSGNERVLYIVGPDESFGGLGLVTGALRNATVRAITDTDLFVISKGTFDRLLREHIHLPDFAPTLQSLAELRALLPFAHLSSAELTQVQANGSWQPLAPGDNVITQGDTGDAFYVVGTGRLDVFQDSQRVGHLDPGDHFGEVALLTDVPRTATVTATTPARVFRLERPGFEQLIAGAVRTGRLAPSATFQRE